MFGTNTYALLNINMGFPGGSVVKNPPVMQETWVLSLGWGDPLEKEVETHFSILAWGQEGSWMVRVHGVSKVLDITDT